jgi:hypothetical protein
MTTSRSRSRFAFALGVGLLLSCGVMLCANAVAQAPAATPAAVSQLGTVKTVSGSTLTMTMDKGAATVTVTVANGAKILQLPVGSKDLTAAKPGTVADIAVGDRALVTGKPGTAGDTLTAMRVVVMKSSDIAQMQAGQQADWKARGIGGIVSTVDAATGTITITSGTKKTEIHTTGKTAFKRFAGDSVKYQDAKTGTLAQVQPKDQLQARGEKSADGLSMQAEEVISGSFENLSGVLLSVDAAAGKITLKDLATKKLMTVNVTANSDLRNMPAMMASRFATQSQGGGGGRRGGGGGGAGASDAADTRRSAGADLSQAIGRMPEITMADLHKGDSVMIVASAPMADSSTVTAVRVLTGIDAILTANPNGGMDLSMSLGGGGGGGE